MKRVTGLARLLRIPGIGALGIPPVIGALTIGVFDLPSLILLFAIGALAAIFGFILNDFVDAELDRLVPELQEKPLVSGVIQRKTAVFICALCAIFAFFLLIILYHGQTVTTFRVTAASMLVLAGVLGSIYDLYGKKLQVEFIDRLRGEQRFASVAELTGQIARDIEAARTALARAG